MNSIARPFFQILAVGITLSTIGGLSPGRNQAAEPTSEWKLTWSDEFAGSEIDRKKWDFDLGNGFYNYHSNQWISGWGNNELQYYTKEPENAFIRDGMLHIRAVKESYQGCGYTSAKLKTRQRDGSPLFNQKYGKFEFRAKLPTEKGVWPALWMLPQGDSYGPWAASGEIDVMEARGQEPGKVLGTVHYGGRWPQNAHSGDEFIFPAGTSMADFHTYAVEWEPGKISWLVDGKVYQTQNFWWSTSGVQGTSGQGKKPAGEQDLNPWPAPFDQPFYLIMNVAVGGNFLGPPDEKSQFPAEMIVDYVRVYSSTKPASIVPPRGEGKLPFQP
ncbi:glycoside hydrolase family 16 [Planctopirus limnophila DSM 3776]|uniref:Glycoside hydrolase family 16 n=1 Tax=Planctopirus limnophila (strain ATCC 43296 / DSM 3776 / IFAM 1008 / Mu 290) TaxID=521674 RepID=D5SVG2_PLAL2|nr:glycoside hydrolase family 16 protein [Planctopirus limnophila]ADG67232.1 glycoside hydrolase family 16 [Planctopirus limnophila DSM 3776]